MEQRRLVSGEAGRRRGPTKELMTTSRAFSPLIAAPKASSVCAIAVAGPTASQTPSVDADQVLPPVALQTTSPLLRLFPTTCGLTIPESRPGSMAMWTTPSRGRSGARS
jgi:hypothetical protein